MEHTKGPWSKSALQGAYIVGPHPQYHVVASVAEFKKNGDVEMLFCGIQAKANARLIAAAPEMLWALKDVRDFLKRNGYDITLVNSVIAKAEASIE